MRARCKLSTFPTISFLLANPGSDGLPSSMADSKESYLTSMLRELNTISERLDAEIEQYLFICSGVYDLCLEGNATRSVPAEHYQKVAAELGRVVSYGTKLQRARLTITKACNSSFGHSPINSMPSEILTHIFHLVMRDEGYPKSSLRYPDYFTQVCSRWRSIALISPALWTRIQFTYQNGPTGQSLVSRAKLHAARAGRLPLEVYITDSYRSNCCRNTLKEFLASIASRIKVFAFDVQDELAPIPNYDHSDTEISESLDGHSESEPLHRMVFEVMLPNCDPAVFRTLAIESQDYCSDFIQPYDKDFGRLNIRLNAQMERLENSFSRLTTLQLCGVFLHWSSIAYHGLADLRLASATCCWSRITEWEFVRILEASPKLQTLRFALEITDPSPDNAQIMPVLLTDLEGLDISALQDSGPTLQLGSILRLVAPGSKLLRLRLQDMPQRGPQLGMVQDFLKRSNIEKLCISTAYPPMQELLPYIPNLTALVFDQCYDPENLDLPNPPSGTSTHSFLGGSWGMQDCALTLSDLSSIVHQYPYGKLLLARCDIYGLTGEKVSDEELLATFPKVTFTDLGKDHLPHRWAPLDRTELGPVLYY